MDIKRFNCLHFYSPLWLPACLPSSIHNMSKFSATDEQKVRREKVAIEKIEFDIVVANNSNLKKICIKINFTTMRYELGNSLRLLTQFVCIRWCSIIEWILKAFFLWAFNFEMKKSVKKHSPEFWNFWEILAKLRVILMWKLVQKHHVHSAWCFEALI